jgi:hypothetical protein
VMGTPRSPLLILSDNQGAIALNKRHQNSKKLRHVDIRHHFVRNHVEAGRMRLEHVSSDNMVADIFTKALPTESHQSCCARMGLQPLG